MKKHNKKGQGYIFKRHGVYYARIKVDGKDIAMSLKTRDAEEAKKRHRDFVQSIVCYDKVATLNHLKAQIETEESKAQRTERIYIKDMFFKYLASPCHSKIVDESVTNYFCMANHFIRWFKRSPYVCDVTLQDAARFYQEIRAHQSIRRCFDIVCCLRRIWKGCMKFDNNIKRNVWADLDVKFERYKAPRRREVSTEEIQRLFAASTAPEFGRYCGEVNMLFQIGAYTGLRLMDCVSLRWHEVGEELIKKIPHKTQKTGTMAVIPMCDTFRRSLKAWRMSGKSSSDYVLPRLSVVCRRVVNRLVARVFDVAGIAISEIGEDGKRIMRTGFHSLRIAALSRFLRLCGDINVVKTIAAHTNANMTLWYTHCQERDVSNAFFKRDAPMSLSAEVCRQISAMKSEGETTDDFIRRLLAKSQPDGASNILEMAS